MAGHRDHGLLTLSLAWFAAAAAVTAAGGAPGAGPERPQTCLGINGTIGPEKRQNVIFGGVSMPLGIVVLDWASTIIETWIYRILVEEVLGINATFSGKFATSAPGFLAVSGCQAPLNYNTDPQCGTAGLAEHHVIYGLWEPYALTAMEYMETEHKSSYPRRLRVLDYPGRDSIFVQDSSITPALADHHVPLEYYMSYSHPTVELHQYFGDPWAISSSRLLPCSETTLWNSMQVEIYYGLSLDLDGVNILTKQVEVYNGPTLDTDVVNVSMNSTMKNVQTRNVTTYRATCFRDNWWLSPACRRNITKCIPFITGGDGWLVDAMMQRSTAFDFPVAVAVANNYAEYQALPLEQPVLLYWWWPDGTFSKVRPVEVLFPPYNQLEWGKGVKTSSSNDITLSNWAHQDLLNRNNLGFQKPVALLEKMTLNQWEIQDLIHMYMENATQERAEELACQWLNNNTQRWKAWIPYDDNCGEGQGLVSSEGRFLPSRAGASKCKWCAPGRMSVRLEDERGVTHTCKPCHLGHYQDNQGETTCFPCNAGESAPEEGSAECVRCKIGKFANAKGQVTCDDCPPGFVTKYPGALTKDSCVCDSGYYRDAISRECLECKQGMTCPLGSDALGYLPNHVEQYPIAPLLDPGFWSSSEEPLNVFLCESDKRCPGGVRPGSACSPKLGSRACARCDPEHVWDGSKCITCGSTTASRILFPVLPVFIFPIIIVFLYKTFGDEYANWGSWQNGVAAVLFILLNHYQTINIVRGVNMSFPESIAGTLDVFVVMTDVMVIFRPGCAGLDAFMDLLIVKSLGPVIVFLMYILVWGISQLAAKFIPAARMDKDRTLNGFFSLIFAFFTGISSMAFTIFICSKGPNGKSTLLADRSVICYEGEWKSMAAVGVLSVIFWCGGFGLLFCRSIFTAPHRLHDPRAQMRWKFLFIKYRQDVHWWALVFVAKGIMLNLGNVVVETGLGQIYWIVFVLSVYLCLASIFRPWRHRVVNAADVWAHLCLALAASATSWFAHGSTLDKVTADSMMATLATVLMFSVCPPALVIIAYMCWSQTSSIAKTKKQLEAQTILDALDRLVDVDKQDLQKFLETLSEWDLWFMSMAKNVIYMELSHIKSRSGYSVQRIMSGAASSLEELEEASISRQSERSRHRSSSNPEASLETNKCFTPGMRSAWAAQLEDEDDSEVEAEGSRRFVRVRVLQNRVA